MILLLGETNLDASKSRSAAGAMASASATTHSNCSAKLPSMPTENYVWAREVPLNNGDPDDIAIAAN